jgi:hypothetical protein
MSTKGQHFDISAQAGRIPFMVMFMRHINSRLKPYFCIQSELKIGIKSLKN